MKIVTWNCQGGFREKFEHIKLLKADIYVIQECTDPEASRGTEYEDYCKFAGEKGKDYYWIGNEPSEEVKSPKGLGIFVKNGLETELINNFYDDFKFFQLIRVKNSFNLFLMKTLLCAVTSTAIKDSITSIQKKIKMGMLKIIQILIKS